jgi:hypothetical protein
MSSEKIKPCPFCGSKARTLPSIAHDREQRATCTYGRCCLFNHCIEVSEWNRRPSPWRPISDAPKDGSIVLGFMNPTWIEGIQFYEDEWFYPSTGDAASKYKTQPTHFMPLPEPPKEG